mgnify:CR=1 FL=1
MVTRLSPVLMGLALSVGAITLSQAQIEQKTPGEVVRERALEKRLSKDPYWDGFAHKEMGDCPTAVELLRPIARRGHGYEDAQVALAECLLVEAGIDDLAGDASRGQAIAPSKPSPFNEALEFLLIAANAGNYKAQAIFVELHATKAAPNSTPIEAAKWAHLYLTNPQRLTLGAPSNIAPVIDYLQASMSRDDWLSGKEMARLWVASFKTPQ